MNHKGSPERSLADVVTYKLASRSSGSERATGCRKGYGGQSISGDKRSSRLRAITDLTCGLLAERCRQAGGRSI